MSELSVQLRNRFIQNNEQVIHHDDYWYTTTDVRSDVQKIQAILEQMNVRVGDRIVISQPNSYAFIVSYISLLLYGATVVPLNPKMPKPEMESIIERSEAVGALIHEDLESTFNQLDNNQTLRFFSVIRQTAEHKLHFSLSVNPQGEWTNTKVTMEEALWEAAATAELLVEGQLAETHPAVLLFTSGTTGTPKGVLLNHSQVMATSKHVSKSHSLTRDDISYCFLPLFHINAQVVAVISTISTGGKLVVEEKFSASKFWSTVAKYNVTWASAVPTVIAILCKTPTPDEIPASMRFIRSASAPLPAAQGEFFETMTGIPVIESYGLTEAASQVCVNPFPPEKHRFGSAGRPCGIELKIVNEHDDELPQGEVGEIAIRGASVVTGYAYGDPTGSSFRGGWFHTGDLGYIDVDGFVFITGRSKEMINRAGQKISPREVEEVILHQANVKVAAVIGLPDELYGERVCAYVIPETSVTDEEAIAFIEDIRKLCLSSVSAYKCPAEFHIVEEIPVGVTGKIQRYRLRQQVLEAERSS